MTLAIPKPSTICVGELHGSNSSTVTLNSANARGALCFSVPESKTLYAIQFPVGSTTGSPTGSTDFELQVCEMDMNTRYPGTVLKTMYFPGRSGAGRLYWAGINVTLEPLKWYYLVFRNNHVDPVNNAIRIDPYIRMCRYFGGVPGNGFVWLVSSDGGATWPTWMDGVLGIDLRFSDGSSIGQIGYHNYYIGQYIDGSVYGTDRWAGVYLRNFPEGRMNVCCLAMAYTITSGAPPQYIMDIMDQEDNSTVYASSVPFYKRVNTGPWQPVQFSQTFVIEPSRRYIFATKAVGGAGDASNYATTRYSPLQDSTFELHNRPFDGHFRLAYTSSAGRLWLYKDDRIPGCVMMLDATTPFLQQTSIPATVERPAYVSQLIYMHNRVFDPGSNRTYNFTGSYPMVLLPFSLLDTVRVDELELWVNAVSAAPTATVSIRPMQPTGIPGNPLVSVSGFAPTTSGWYSLPLTGITLDRGQFYYLAFEIQPSGAYIQLRAKYSASEPIWGGTPYSWDGTTLTRLYTSLLSPLMMIREGSTWYGACTYGSVTITYPKVASSFQMPGKISLYGCKVWVSPSNSAKVRVSLYNTSNWIPTTLIESVDIGVYDLRAQADVYFSQVYDVDNFAIVVEPLNLTTVGIGPSYQAQSNSQPTVDRISRTVPYNRVLYFDNGSWNIHTYNGSYTVMQLSLLYSAWPLYPTPTGSSGGGAIPGMVMFG